MLLLIGVGLRLVAGRFLLSVTLEQSKEQEGGWEDMWVEFVPQNRCFISVSCIAAEGSG
jgi:hypothetical protein